MASNQAGDKWFHGFWISIFRLLTVLRDRETIVPDEQIGSEAFVRSRWKL
jgi:hypothetical protein